MKNFIKNWALWYILGVMVIMSFLGSKVWAGQYVFQGVYTPQEILIAYCENCYLGLPAEYLETKLVLAVNTDREQELFKALQAASSAAGWDLKKNKNKVTAELAKHDDNVYYLSCVDSLPHSVNRASLAYYLLSDSLKCQAREQRQKDFLDSINAVVPVDYSKYRLKYYAYTKSFTDKMGVTWSEILAKGTLHNLPKILDNWALYAVENNDTTFTYRELSFSLDTLINVDWGSEEQTLKNTFIQDGVLYNDYEWRKYGLIINIQRNHEQVKMQYTFRDKSENVQLLQGQAIGNNSDTLQLYGTYNYVRSTVSGIPFISKIPVLGRLFEIEQQAIEARQFQIFLIPEKEK